MSRLNFAKYPPEVGARIHIQMRRHHQMAPLEIRSGEAINKDEAAHPAELARGAGQEFEDQERRIVDRAGNVGERHESR